MLIKRQIGVQLLDAAREYPVIAVIGPRYAGKTTLVQMTFPDHRYISLEDFDLRELALADPRRFLTEYPSSSGIILDEIQNAPQLLSYMQTIVDREKKKGFFVVTGSQNILVHEAISQTLAGRIAILTLLPLSVSELDQANVLPDKIETAVWKGAYPQVYAENSIPSRLYSNYILTYVERDVRQMRQITDLEAFQRFIRLCAGRIGQVVNLESLGNDCGVNHSTVKAWLSVLEASYIIFSLYPYYKNFGRRLIKSPKIYFVDTGLACSLLNIKSEEDLDSHYLRGGLIESFIISDLRKQRFNLEQQPNIYFWRDHTGNEIDCILDETNPIPVEIKSGKTVAKDFFKAFDQWQEWTQLPQKEYYVVYGGVENQNWPQATVLGWKAAGSLIKSLSEN
ncbi:MAG TPA: ATP-binding protein [Candidatus Babeliales bacterium]|nr:ATP-binding protein [Candidatus Babeliales bacterium]